MDKPKLIINSSDSAPFIWGNALAALRKAGKDVEAQKMDHEICNVYPDRDKVIEVIKEYCEVET